METYFVDGIELQEPNERWAIVFLERAHEHIRHDYHFERHSQKLNWHAYHEALCIIENALCSIDPSYEREYRQ